MIPAHPLLARASGQPFLGFTSTPIVRVRQAPNMRYSVPANCLNRGVLEGLTGNILAVAVTLSKPSLAVLISRVNLTVHSPSMVGSGNPSEGIGGFTSIFCWQGTTRVKL